MTTKSPETPFQKHQDNRIFALLIAIALGLGWLMIRWLPGVDPSSARWVAGSLGRMGIAMGLVWLAYPQLLLLKRLPGGGQAVFACLACAMVIAFRPKAIFYLGPIAAAATTLLMALSWLAKSRRS